MEFKYRIYRTPEGRWFVDIPDWDGEKDELELVDGADTMCEIIAQGEKQFKCVFSDEKIKASYTLIKTRDGENEIGGAWYVMPTYGSIQYDLNVWLCDVTSKLFGRFPDIIYFYREHF